MRRSGRRFSACDVAGPRTLLVPISPLRVSTAEKLEIKARPDASNSLDTTGQMAFVAQVLLWTCLKGGDAWTDTRLTIAIDFSLSLSNSDHASHPRLKMTQFNQRSLDLV